MNLADFFVVVGYSAMVLSLWHFKKGKSDIALVSLILCALCLRISCSLDPVLHTWDERYHALVAKNLLSDISTPILFKHEFDPNWHTDWPNWKVWLHKPPLALYTMALSLKCFGITPFALRIPSIILSSISVILGFRITRNYYTITMAYWVAFFTAIHGFLIELSSGRASTDHVDMFFIFFVLLSIDFFINHSKTKNKYSLIFAGVSIGFALLTKWLPALVVFPVAWLIYAEAKHSIKHRTLYLAISSFIALCMFLPWEIYQYLEFSERFKFEFLHRFGHFDKALDGRGKPWWYHLDQLRIRFGELVYLPIIYFIWHSWKHKKKQHFIFIIWMLIVYGIFSISRTKMAGHVMIACLPIFVMCSFMIHTISEQKLNGWKLISSRLLIFLLVALPIRYSIERVKPFAKMQDPVVYSKKYQNGHGFVFGYEDAVRFNFHNQWEAYRYIPTQSVLDSLTRNSIPYELPAETRVRQP